MKIYVGNMTYDTTEEDIRLACAVFGKVESTTIIKDKSSGQSKGFGFVEMLSKAEGQAAIDGLNGKEVVGRALQVNEARPRTENSGGSAGSHSVISKGEYNSGKRGYSGSRKGIYSGSKEGYSGSRGRGGNRL